MPSTGSAPYTIAAIAAVVAYNLKLSRTNGHTHTNNINGTQTGSHTHTNNTNGTQTGSHTLWVPKIVSWLVRRHFGTR